MFSAEIGGGGGIEHLAVVLEDWKTLTVHPAVNGYIPDHYANMSVQYTAIFHGCINGNFQMKKCDIFLIFALKHRLWVHVVPTIYVLEQK